MLTNCIRLNGTETDLAEIWIYLVHSILLLFYPSIILEDSFIQNYLCNFLEKILLVFL